MVDSVKLRPGIVQVRYRMGFSPPNFQIGVNDTTARLAAKVAELFNLKSSNMVFNQNALSTQFLSFRYIIPGDTGGLSLSQIPYFDVSIGVDQAEILFFNPFNLAQFRETYVKLFEAIIHASAPVVSEHYFETTVHASSKDFNVHEYIDKVVLLQSPQPIQKGFSFVLTHNQARAQMSIDRSAMIADALFVFSSYTVTQPAQDSSQLMTILDSAVDAYRQLQSIACIEIEEAPE